ncbi:hypothetical protein RD055328_07550 [Companilactobacillus sp. RD055328]|uniref:tetratricopeptide repeat protein n=1 Tax=Companilactobacillus sp. RD055328 TaxID=2916634 RepID=UPI001FC802FE|nr:tetratricopeptide repeat protein [Companilactobacillus sp. RD055328]GKQ42832.1 hypothetical protein RD055328_07550 [Companilactobacillus sp. RD055328]
MNEVAKQAAKQYESGDKEAAVITLTKALNDDFKQLEIILQLSTYLSYGGEFEQAEELLKRSLNIFPDEDTIKYNLGNIYFNQSKIDQALPIFTELLKTEMRNPASFMLAQCYQQLGDNNHALVYAITAAENEHEDEGYAQLVGDIFLAMGNVKDAKKYYLISTDIRKNERNTFNLGVCLFTLDDPKAQSVFKESKAINQKYYEDNIQRLTDIQKIINENK